MTSKIVFTLNVAPHSSQAHQIRPSFPTILGDHDTRRTIAMNKISASLPKKYLNHKRHLRLEAKQNFLPLTPTMVPAQSPVNIDIQAKLGRTLRCNRPFIRSCSSLESVILKTVDCEIIDLFNQMVINTQLLLSFTSPRLA